MSDKEEVFDNFRESFKKMEGHFHVLEQRVPVEQQMEYFKYSEHLRKSNLNPVEEDFEDYKKDIYDKEAPTEHKRYALSVLASSNHVKAYRILEEYVQNPDPELTNWAHMALMESRIGLESELLEEKQIYISTGLGGKGDKLRFYVLMAATENKPFEEYQRQTIEREFTYYLPKEGCEIERLTIEDVYVELVFLIPVMKDIKFVLEHVLNECNQYGNFLSPVFTVTNVKELTADEVKKIMQTRFKAITRSKRQRGNRTEGDEPPVL